MTCVEIENELYGWEADDVPTVAEIVSLYTEPSRFTCGVLETGVTDDGDPWVAIVTADGSRTVLHVANDNVAGTYYAYIEPLDREVEAETAVDLLQEIEEIDQCASSSVPTPLTIGQTPS